MIKVNRVKQVIPVLTKGGPIHSHRGVYNN